MIKFYPGEIENKDKECFLKFICEKQSRVLLVLDGLDEADPINLKMFANLVESRDLSGCYIVLTSRHEAGRKVRRFCDTLWEIVGFTKEDAEDFIRKYFKNIKKEHLAEKLIAKIWSSDKELHGSKISDELKDSDQSKQLDETKGLHKCEYSDETKGLNESGLLDEIEGSDESESSYATEGLEKSDSPDETEGLVISDECENSNETEVLEVCDRPDKTEGSEKSEHSDEAEGLDEAELLSEAEGLDDSEHLDEIKGTAESENSNETEGLEESDGPDETKGLEKSEHLDEAEGLDESELLDEIEGSAESENSNETEGLEESDSPDETEALEKSEHSDETEGLDGFEFLDVSAEVSDDSQHSDETEGLNETNKWDEYEQSDESEHLDEFENVYGSKSLKELTKNPLNATLLCVLYENLEDDLPTSRTNLYIEIVLCVLRRYEQKQGLSSKIEDLFTNIYKASLLNLGRMALQSLQKGELYSEEHECDSSISTMSRFGFLSLQAAVSKLKTTERYVFLHKSFQEFFSGFYLANQILNEDIDCDSVVTDRRYMNELHQVFFFFMTGILARTKKENAGTLVKSMAVNINSRSCENDKDFAKHFVLVLRCLSENLCLVRTHYRNAPIEKRRP